jgi:hypothetical protein
MLKSSSNFATLAKSVVSTLKSRGLEITQQNILDVVHEENGEGYSIWKDEFPGNKSSNLVELEKEIANQ